jgi:hypothetical protein
MWYLTLSLPSYELRSCRLCLLRPDLGRLAPVGSRCRVRGAVTLAGASSAKKPIAGWYRSRASG